MRVLCDSLSQIPNIGHGFFTREGGVSEGAFASLNCGFGSGDLNTSVAQNRAFVARALGITANKLCTAYQTHSAETIAVTEPWPHDKAPQADALVTNVPGIAIGVLTADCLPILLTDGKKGVIAAVHAGWKGALSGVIESGLRAMEELGARAGDTVACVGPGIEQCSYEVGAEFRDTFLKDTTQNEIYFEPSSREEHFMFDLKAYAKSRLEALGLASINMLAHDTCLEENRFFSYRRACQRGESVYGRQISAIVLKP